MSGKQEFRGLKGLKKQRRIQVIALAAVALLPTTFTKARADFLAAFTVEVFLAATFFFAGFFPAGFFALAFLPAGFFAFLAIVFP